MKFRPANQGNEILEKDYRKKIIFSLDDFAEEGHLLQVVTIPPHTRQRVHFHHRQTEVFYILEGETSITIKGKEYSAKPGDAFICSPGDVHNLWNRTEEDFKLLVFKINKPREEDTTWKE
jgi:mannose-6-phosphate isomerase-like protein (cupin superfamily)